MRLPSFLALALVSACGFRGGEEVGEAPPVHRVDEQGRIVLTPAEREALDLQTATIETGTLTTVALRFGTVVGRPEEDVLVVAPFTGRLSTSFGGLGASVSTGDPLVVIEPLVDVSSRASLEAEHRQLQGRIEGAESQIEAKRVELEQVTTLLEVGLATAADRAQAEATLRSEQARVESLRRASEQLEQAIAGSLTLTAPSAGTVARIASETGSLVQQGTVLARIVSSGPRWIDVAVPPGDPVGDAYRVKGGPARLLARGSLVQPDGTRRDRLETDPENAPDLPPGATVAVDVLYEKPGLLVPAQAVVHQGQDELVFVEVEAGRFAPRVVEVGARQDRLVTITSGLAAGERVVTLGSASLLGELGASGPPPKEDER